MGAANKEIFLVGAFSRSQFHWILSSRCVNEYWVLRALSCMLSWNITLWKISHPWKIFAIQYRCAQQV